MGCSRWRSHTRQPPLRHIAWITAQKPLYICARCHLTATILIVCHVPQIPAQNTTCVMPTDRRVGYHGKALNVTCCSSAFDLAASHSVWDIFCVSQHISPHLKQPPLYKRCAFPFTSPSTMQLPEPEHVLFVTARTEIGRSVWRKAYDCFSAQGALLRIGCLLYPFMMLRNVGEEEAGDIVNPNVADGLRGRFEGYF